jgi:hypothetical protein
MAEQLDRVVQLDRGLVMSETIVASLVGLAGVIFGAFSTAVVTLHGHRKDAEAKSSDLLLEAQKQLAQTMEDCSRLWAYNRSLVDHIYRRAPPPPPEPPEDLFKH